MPVHSYDSRQLTPDRYCGHCEARDGGQEYRCQWGLHRGTIRSIAVIQNLFSLATTLIVMLTAVSWKGDRRRDDRVDNTSYALLATVTFIASLFLAGSFTAFLWN